MNKKLFEWNQTDLNRFVMPYKEVKMIKLNFQLNSIGLGLIVKIDREAKAPL